MKEEQKLIIKGQNITISDGYHTFDQLYDHRCTLFVLLCLMQPIKCRWKKDKDTPGWIILYLETNAGQVSYHVPEHFEIDIKKQIIEDPEYQWDGHTSAMVLHRLKNEIRVRSMDTGELLVVDSRDVGKRKKNKSE